VYPPYPPYPPQSVITNQPIVIDQPIVTNQSVIANPTPEYAADPQVAAAQPVSVPSPNPEPAPQAAPSAMTQAIPPSANPEPAPQAAPTKAQIIPHLPNPDSKETYRLQVGSFLNQEVANELENRLKAVGFNVAREFYNTMYRVIVTDVPAAMVQFAAQRLEIMGITQIWVRQ
jgi:cell division protein FtsN